MKYYGFMVNELTGEIDKLEGEFNYKPQHENCSMLSFAKWFKSESERDKAFLWTKNEIKNIRNER